MNNTDQATANLCAPIHVHENQKHNSLLWNSHNTLIAEVLGPEREANAELIVKAVNCHDELVQILRDTATWLETNLKLGTINAGTANRDGDLVSQIQQVLSKA